MPSPRTASASASASSSSSSARAASAPYARRSVAQPKSTRQQFSACGACRMRRVRCDLKDLVINASQPHPTCSNCKERGIKCVDEFADVKAVKLLRRGRRLQQVEAIYGKTADSDNSAASSYATRLQNSIPALHADFFYSPFWRWFCIQRPILDATEFSARFLSHSQGERPFGREATLVSMLLVVWAFTFGLNERGLPLYDDAHPKEQSRPSSSGSNSAIDQSLDINISSEHQRHQESREKIGVMVQQVLELIDIHGILRRPSFDGLRALLLLLPLLEDVKPLERQAIHDAAMLHAQALCSLPSPSHVAAQVYDDASARARLFWHPDDHESFQRSLPPSNYPFGNHGLPSPSSPSASLPVLPPDAQKYNRLINSSTLPSQLNVICRRIHNILTGPRAARRAEEHNLIDAHGMREIWNDLDRCWRDFNAIRCSASTNEDSASRFDTESYACAWMIFIFECHNVIRESLRQYASMGQSPSSYANGSSSRPSSVSSTSPYLSPQHLQVVATRKCLGLLPNVIRIMKYCINCPRDSARSGIFVWDSGLVRDGCFFAGYLAASADGDILDSPLDIPPAEMNEGEGSLPPLTADEGVMICLSALSSMRWSFSKSEEREETIRMIWETRKSKRHGQSARYADVPYDAAYPQSSGPSNAQLQSGFQGTSRPMLSATSYPDRPMLPALSHFSQSRRVGSAPNTACTTDGQGAHGWPTYTPPGTATSIATSATGLSIHGSPDFSSALPSFKPQSDDGYYHSGGDLDPFTYSVPIPNTHQGHVMSNTTHAPSYIPPHSSHFSSGPDPVVASGNDYASCPQFGDNCNASYH
ncbi:hypothetical protein EST38_g972 [Candolleomyces aberdarensis]|uniref:Zn(2)-C6 fungal-type domain-containing protein n=1 Tax=Candolleomyces aberdarensis TaxID=2316362 RepID=A0A4Q2DWS6_9AGAR|nr:hypothetical protein EST38_g972 [Candolleomyces aberdarensis]